MAEQSASPTVPTPMESIRYVRNGLSPVAGIGSRVLAAYHHALACRRKLVFSKSLHLDSIPASSATTLTPWRTYLRTGYAASGALRLRFWTLGAPSDTSAADPRVLWNLSGGVSSPPALRVGVNTGTIGPNDLVPQIASVEVAANTAYEIDCQLINYGRIVAAAIWEEHDLAYEDGDTGVPTSQNVSEGGVITDNALNDLLFTGHNLWLGNAAPVLAWCTDQDPDNGGTAPTRSTASYRNIFDQTVSSVSETSRGFLPSVRYHHPFHSDNVEAVFAVYAQNASSAGGDVRLLDQSGTLGTVSSFSTSGEWKATAVNLDGTVDRYKLDVHLQGDGTNNLIVHALALYEYAT